MSKLTNTTLFTALVTPFNEDGTIDYLSLDSLIEKQVQAGNGLLLIGSTGEGLALTTQEKLALLQHVCEQNLSVPILVGVGGFQLEETLHWLKACEALPIDGYLLVTPIYARPGPQGQVKWFHKLLDAVSKPCMLYNVPARTGCSLEIEVLKRLKNHPNLWALKEASGSIDQFRAYQNAAPEIALFCGNDDLMPILAKEGAKGLVSVMANVWPQATSHYLQLSLQKKITTDSALLPAIRSVNNRNPVSVKVLLHALNQIDNSQLRAPLSEEDGSSPEELLEKHLEVERWMQAIPSPITTQFQQNSDLESNISTPSSEVQPPK